MSKLGTIEERGIFSPCDIRPQPNNLYELTENLYYTWRFDGYLRRIMVPKGFLYDGASIPMLGTVITKLLPWFETIYPMGAHWRATAFHDFIWMYQGRTPVGCYDVWHNNEWADIADVPEFSSRIIKGQVFTFESSNRLFGRHLKESGIGQKERNTMQWSVGTFIGKRNWLKGTPPSDARAIS